MKKIITFLLSALPFYSLQFQDDSSSATRKQATDRVTIKNFVLYSFILLLFCSTAFKMYGQTEESLVKKIYLQPDGIQAILKHNWSTTFSYHQIDGIIPKNQPSDYRPETGTFFFLFLPFQYSKQVTASMEFYSFTAGKYFPVNREIWFTAEAGPSLVIGDNITYLPSNTNRQTYEDFLVPFFGNSVDNYSNYSTSIRSKTIIGGMLHADFNWAFSSFMGIGAGVYANFNSIHSELDYQFKLILGWMHRGKKEKYQGTTE